MVVSAVPVVCGRPEKDCRESWLEFFSDPSQWWDHRTAKVNEINFFMISLLARNSQCRSWFS
jgi:hypothetical protein